jgi:hypothetical protein
MIIIGIDPGAKGGVAIYDEAKHKMILHKCPETPKEMAAIINTAKVKDKNVFCVIEKVHAFPTDARSSAFKFGCNFGKWLGILGAYDIPTLEVTPQVWMKPLQPLPKIKTERKNQLKQIAINLFPENKITLSTSDAALMVVWYVNNEKDN